MRKAPWYYLVPLRYWLVPRGWCGKLDQRLQRIRPARQPGGRDGARASATV